MSRFSTIQVKDIYAWLNINDPDCGNKTAIFNRILREFYTHISGTKLAKRSVAFTGSGNKIIQFNEGIKQIHDFIVQGDCLNKKCFQILQDCGKRCSEKLFQMFMQETWSTPNVGQYIISKDGTGSIITTNIANGVTNGRVIYSKWPETISSITDTIEIDDNALLLLEILIMKTYAERERDANMATYYKNEFQTMLAKEKENQEKLPYRIIWLHQEYDMTDKTYVGNVI